LKNTDNPDQTELLLVVWGLTGWDMSGFETWISMPKIWDKHPQKLAHLLTQRERLAHAYRQHKNNDELLTVYAELLFSESHRVASLIRGVPLEVAANKQSKINSLRRQGKVKLTASQIRGIKRAWSAAFSTYGLVKSLAREYEVSEDTISRLIKNSAPA